MHTKSRKLESFIKSFLECDDDGNWIIEVLLKPELHTKEEEKR